MENFFEKLKLQLEKMTPEEKDAWILEQAKILPEYSGRFYTPIPEIGNHRSDMKETAIPF